MPRIVTFGGQSLAKRKKAPRPYRIEHRAVDPLLVAECSEWGTWQKYADYAMPKDRDRCMKQLLNQASGRWEYRIAGPGTDEKSVAHSAQGVV
jgi:hypothetical protein